MNAEQLSLYEAQVVGAPHNGTLTSIEAARVAGPKVGPQKLRMLKALAKHGDFSQDEMADHLYFPRSTVAGRFNEMERDGLIAKTGAVRPSKYGGACAVYDLTPAGREEAAR